MTVADDIHAEGFGPDGDLLSNPAQADNPDGFATQLMAGDALPLPGPHVVGFFHQMPAQGQEEGESVFRHGGVIDSGAKSHGNFELARSRQIDFIQTDAVFRHDLEPRQ